MPELLFRLGAVKLGEVLRGRSLGGVQRRDSCEHRIDRDEIGKTTGLSYGAPRPMKMGNIVSLWRYEAATFHARAPL